MDTVNTSNLVETVWNSQIFSILACERYFRNSEIRRFFMREIIKAFEIDRISIDGRIWSFICVNHLDGCEDLSNLILRFRASPSLRIYIVRSTQRAYDLCMCTVHSFRGPESYSKLSVIDSILEKNRIGPPYIFETSSVIILNSNLVKLFYFGFLIFFVSQFYYTFASRKEDDGMYSLPRSIYLAQNDYTYGYGMDLWEAGSSLSSYLTNVWKHPPFE